MGGHDERQLDSTAAKADARSACRPTVTGIATTGAVAAKAIGAIRAPK